MDAELLVVADCPHTRPAAALLREALDDIGLASVSVTTTVVDTAEQAETLTFRGSPTIMVNGVDVFPGPASSPGLACRMYPHADGTINGLPTLRDLQQALTQVAARPPGPRPGSLSNKRTGPHASSDRPSAGAVRKLSIGACAPVTSDTQGTYSAIPSCRILRGSKANYDPGPAVTDALSRESEPRTNRPPEPSPPAVSPVRDWMTGRQTWSGCAGQGSRGDGRRRPGLYLP